MSDVYSVVSILDDLGTLIILAIAAYEIYEATK